MGLGGLIGRRGRRVRRDAAELNIRWAGGGGAGMVSLGPAAISFLGVLRG